MTNKVVDLRDFKNRASLRDLYFSIKVSYLSGIQTKVCTPFWVTKWLNISFQVLTRGLTVRPELVEGWTVKPFMVRQAHHERLNLAPNTRKLLFSYLIETENPVTYYSTYTSKIALIIPHCH
jgi:hypothetical protein